MEDNEKTLQEVKITHYGKWIIDDEKNISINCYVTNDERRILSLRGTAKAMGLKGGGSGALLRNLNSKWIEPYLTDNLRQWMKDMEGNNIELVRGNNSKNFYPFDGDLFVDLCKAYVQADKDGVFEGLKPPFDGNQKDIADRMLSIMSAFAKVGIVALIDEVTGYQYDREKDELQKLLSAYVREEFLPWTRRFPEEFYKEMFRLKKWEYRGNAKSPLVGKYTNKFVYDVLPESVLEELKEKNPVIQNKSYRRYRYHQFLTEETGIPHLDRHLASVITLMRASDNWKEFENLFEKVFSKAIH